MAFQVPKEVEVSYLADSVFKGVAIQMLETDFFDQQAPYPESWTWDQSLGIPIPFLFHTESRTAVVLEENKASVGYDIIAGAFYFLSGWQERFSPERDRFGRFPYKASLQHQLECITLPVVNYYFELLRQAIEHVYKIKLTPRLASEGNLVFNLTHDIDRLTSGWKIAGLHEMREGRIDKVLRLIWQKVAGKDAWDNVEEMALEEHNAAIPATYFFLPEPNKWNGEPNADYDVTSVAVQQKMARLEKLGAEISLHGSFGCSTDPTQFVQEAKRTGRIIKGNRFHYLLFNPQKTPTLLDAVACKYDATLGFAEHFGFRHAYCLPFYLFDFENGHAHKCLEIPLNLMDVTLHHPNYLQHTPESAIVAVKPLLAEVTKFNGVLSVLWHNEHYSDYKYAGWRAVVDALQNEARKLGAAFKSSGQLAEAFSFSLTSG
jgi:hypothetical protein